MTGCEVIVRGYRCGGCEIYLENWIYIGDDRSGKGVDDFEEGSTLEGGDFGEEEIIGESNVVFVFTWFRRSWLTLIV